MERSRGSAPTTDRELREALEQVQMELRAAREQLPQAAENATRAEEALRTSITEAATRRADAAARLRALQAERTALKTELKDLDRRLEEKRLEDGLLARGAALRDEYVDWNKGDHLDHRWGATRPELIVKMLGMAVLLTIAIAGSCGK